MSNESDEQGRDFLMENILIKVELREYWVYMEFSDWRVHVGSEFLLQKDGNALGTIQPQERLGDIAPLWRACGQKVVQCDWGDVPTLTFETGLSLSIPEDGHPRGEIWSKHHPIVDDF